VTRFVSIVILITFIWTTLVQASPFSDSDQNHDFHTQAVACSSAVMSLVNNEGDPRRAFKAFASRDTFQSLGMSMLSAGLTYGALDALNLPTDITKLKEFTDHAANQGVNAGVRVAMDLGINGKTDGIAAGLGAIAGTIGGYLSSRIGSWYSNTAASTETFLIHKTLHALNGAGQGMIVGMGDLSSGEGLGKAIAGAVGAVAAETFADLVMPTGGSALPGYKGSGLNKDDHATKIRQTQAAARFVAAAVAWAAGMSAADISIAVMTANAALDHNFGPSAEMAWDHESAQDKADIKNLSPEEREVFDALAQAAGTRYQECVEAGMTHEQALGQVAVELKQTLEDSAKPGVQKAAWGLGLKGGVWVLEKFPAIVKAGEVVLKHLKDIVNVARATINLDQYLKEQPKSSDGANTKAGANEQASNRG
jgi:hypothetical protein